jgi:Lipid A 3-O-deacylase (PagL)
VPCPPLAAVLARSRLVFALIVLAPSSVPADQRAARDRPTGSTDVTIAPARDRNREDPASGARVPASPDTFTRNALGIELGGSVFLEAWNLNGRQEQLLDGSAAIWWAWTDGFSLVNEYHATRVFQEPSRDAFVHSLVPLIRWRVLDRKAADWFAELGPGISWSDTGVPPRGTRFNYLVAAGTGIARRLTPQVHATMSFRWLHLSNSGREGRGRNPDIEAFGGYIGLAVAF